MTNLEVKFMTKTFDREKAKNATINELKKLILLALDLEISEANLAKIDKLEKIAVLSSCVDMGDYLLFKEKEQPQKYKINFINVYKNSQRIKMLKLNSNFNISINRVKKMANF